MAEDFGKIVLIRPDGYIKVISNAERVEEIIKTGVQSLVEVAAKEYTVRVILEADLLRTQNTVKK